MSTRASGFNKIPNDLYETPDWVVGALAEHINLNGLCVWEPACGSGKMVQALNNRGADFIATDLVDQGFADMEGLFDFTSDGAPPWGAVFYDAIISNPPYGPQGRTGEAFIRRGLERTRQGGTLALLLPVDFDSAKTRAKYFGDCPDFAAKIVLRRRIAWFEPQPGQAGPSANHAWFVWERSHVRRGPAVTLYSPSNAVEKTISQEAA